MHANAFCKKTYPYNLLAHSMLSTHVLEHIKSYSVIINCYSEVRFIDTMNEFLGNMEFDTLAHELSLAPAPYDFKWKEVEWLSYYSDGFAVLIQLRYEADTAWGPICLMRDIVLIDGSLIANHISLTIPDDLQGKGISKAINRILYKQYRLGGVKIIRLNATLTAGGYVWALAGFCATDRKEVQTILDCARKKAEQNIANGSDSILIPALCDLLQKRIDFHYAITPDKHLPMGIFSSLDCGEEILKGTEWSGEIDLADLSQYSIFEEHLNK
ncbi:hypothetical protein ACW9KT_10835 [Hymenobacter sp. HD11105]